MKTHVVRVLPTLSKEVTKEVHISVKSMWEGVEQNNSKLLGAFLECIHRDYGKIFGLSGSKLEISKEETEARCEIIELVHKSEEEFSKLFLAMTLQEESHKQPEDVEIEHPKELNIKEDTDMIG
jgi:hypothetical protein